MAGRLSARTVETARSPGLLADGDGLYLQVTVNARTGAVRKSWVYRYRNGGHTREMGLGALSAVPLAKAREAAHAARQLRAAGVDPVHHRKASEREQRIAAERARTFEQVADEYISTHRRQWRNDKHGAQWSSTLKRYAFPKFGKVPVADVTVAHVREALDPIWTTKTETAMRVRGRIEQILDYAHAMDLRNGDNPARWRGRLALCLPAPSRVRSVTHHAALPYAAVGDFIAKLREHEGLAAKALEFAILTAARTGEVIGAKWSEVDFQAALWTVPAARMKTSRQHRVPLSTSAMVLLEAPFEHRGSSEYIFCMPGAKRPISNMAMLMVIKRMGLKGSVTAHGFRSSFRDWAAEQTHVDSAIAEAALSHSPGSKVQKAYLRADRLEQRRELMESWDTYITHGRL